MFQVLFRPPLLRCAVGGGSGVGLGRMTIYGLPSGVTEQNRLTRCLNATGRRKEIYDEQSKSAGI
jgi:hypothetical protein